MTRETTRDIFLEEEATISIAIDEQSFHGIQSLGDQLSGLRDEIKSLTSAVELIRGSGGDVVASTDENGAVGMSPAGVVMMTKEHVELISRAMRSEVSMEGEKAKESIKKKSDEEIARLVEQAAKVRAIAPSGDGGYSFPGGEAFDPTNQEHLARIAESLAGKPFDKESVMATAGEWGIDRFAKTGRLGDIDWMKMGQKSLDGLAAAGGKAGTAAGSLSTVMTAASGAIAVAMVVKTAVDAGIAQYTEFRNTGMVTGESGLAAAGRGVDMDVQARVMAISPFINVEQAKQIVNSVYKEGYVGKEAETVLDFASRNFEEFNIDVASSINMYNATVKEGTSSIEELSASMSTMREIAKNSSMSMDDVTNTFVRMAEKFKAGMGISDAGDIELSTAAVGALAKSGISETTAESMVGTMADPLSSSWLMLMGKYSQGEIQQMQSTPEGQVKAHEEVLIMGFVNAFGEQEIQFAMMFDTADEYVATARDVPGRVQMFAVIKGSLVDFGYGKAAEDFDEAHRAFYNAVHKTMSTAVKEQKSVQNTPVGMGGAERTLRAAFGMASPVISSLGLASRNVAGGAQKLWMAGSGLAGAIGGSGETFDQFVERFDEHDFADEKAFADTTIELAKFFGKEYTPLEEERLRSGIINDKTRVEVVLSMQTDVKEIVTAWVRGEEVNRSVGQGSMSTNER